MDIGIIGGADGPTSILVSSSLSKWIIGGAAVVLLFGIIFLVGLRRRGK
ncbi:MAG: hypothetical protein AB9835_13285 [Eubacteriales bacterium]